MELLPIFKRAYFSLAFLSLLYFTALWLLTFPFVQNNLSSMDSAIYMHKFQVTWFKDLTKPEQFGFAKNQVTPFFLPTPDGERIFAWHVLPLGTLMEHRDELVTQETGLVEKPLETKNLKLLMEDPEARLIIFFHGNAGTVGAAYRPAYMRTLSAAHPNKIHIITIDYRGFGLSSGAPSEEGLITDGMTVIRFAMEQLGIPPSRIAVAGQSLGTAVTFGATEAFAAQDPPIEFSAVVAIAAFSDLKKLILTYRIGGWFPILSPLRGYPMVQQYFVKYLLESWDATARVASLVKRSSNLNLVLVHAENDWEIPWKHCDALFAAAANAISEIPLTLKDALDGKVVKAYGDESTLATWPEEKSKGRRINQWVVKWGGHNEVVTSAGTSLIVAKALGL